ncbi:ABC transporter substrate-binding protein [Kineococcus sp. TBRC 1896]|uniref:Thiamine pyrimidine synthase n=1 Tax=Kineococcus mangrovi TaxID=1660183 RepID=A0ABV4HWL7_9ACTN
MTRFHVTATGHSLNYLPEYVATWRGFFAEEDLTVTATVPRPWDLVLDELADGSADAALGGIWVPSMYRGRATEYTPFAQIANRAPLALVGRERAEDFSWAAMSGRTVSMKGSNGASVGLYLKLVLAEQGVDPRSVNYVQDLDGAMLSTLMAGGMGDYLVVDHPSALTLCARTDLHVVAPLAVVTPDVPWSVYYAQGASDAARVELQGRFVRGLGRAMDWIDEHPAAEYRDFLARTFPAFDPDLLVRVADEYRTNSMWTTPVIDRAGYDRWQTGIAAGHLVTEPIAYEEFVDSRPTNLLPTAR